MNSPAVACRERAREIMRLTRKGLSANKIAEELGITTNRVKDIQVKEIAKADALEGRDVNYIRRVELQRLDEMLSSIYEEAIGTEWRQIPDLDGEMRAVRQSQPELFKLIIQIQERRARYIPGLEVPKEIKQDITTTKSIDEQLSGLLEKMSNGGVQLPKTIDGSSEVVSELSPAEELDKVDAAFSEKTESRN